MQCHLANIINMGHIQTNVLVLSTVELTTCLKQVRKKWRGMFRTCIKLFPPTPVYVCMYYIRGYKWSTKQSAQISLKQDKRSVYAIKKTTCGPGYNHSGNPCTWAHDVCCNCISGLQVPDLPHSHYIKFIYII